MDETRVVLSMGLLRFLSAGIEFTAALLILRGGSVGRALQINAALGLVGPTILILVTAIGVTWLASQVSPGRFLLLLCAVLFILLATA